MSNLHSTIMMASFISFIFGMISMFIIIFCYESYCENKKYKSNYSYEKIYDNDYDDTNIEIKPESDEILDSKNNDFSPLSILQNNKKGFVTLFILCLSVGFYCGNMLLQVKMHY